MGEELEEIGALRPPLQNRSVIVISHSLIGEIQEIILIVEMVEDHAVDIPLASLAKKLQGNPQEEKDETDENIEGLTADFQARKKAERKAKKAERRGQEKTAIKTHFSSIVTSLKEKRANRKKKKQGEVIIPTPVSEEELKKLPPEKEVARKS